MNNNGPNIQCIPTPYLWVGAAIGGGSGDGIRDSEDVIIQDSSGDDMQDSGE